MEIVADDRAVDAGHGLLEPLGPVGWLPVAGDESINAEGIEGIKDDLTLGPGRGARALMDTTRIEGLSDFVKKLRARERPDLIVAITLIAALAVRYRLSRAKIAELLVTWFGVRLSAGTIDRCIREAGLACEPIVEGLLTDLRQSGLINADETPWPQRGHLRWLWVALSSTTAIYKIASRRAEEIRDLIGEAFLGWLVSDGYVAYRDHPRRQRCLAHLIRKGIGLADGFDYDAARFGAWLVRELRGLIHAVAENAKAGSLTPILARLKRACRLNEDAAAAKARALAREILNDWEAITAFVTNPNLPPTNNDAETALRHAVIARRISFGTRTDEGSRAYAAILSVVETCRRRKLDPWALITEAVANARRGVQTSMLPAPMLPT